MAVVCIDCVAATVLSFGLLTGVWYLWQVQYPQGDLPARALWAVPVTVYLYFTVLKRSRVRTLGYVLADVRIVDIEGRRPSLLRMTIRMLPLPLVPWSLLFDLGWMVDEPRRQTLRDKWAGTFVIRRKAKPVGTAPIRYQRIGFVGLFLISSEVARPETPVPSAP